MGRKTYVEAEAMSGSVGGDSAEAGGPFSGVETYVFSRTLERLKDPRANLVSEDAGEFVRRLKTKSGKGICVMGGGEFARALFEAEVVDEVGLNTHPVLLGGGVPMFPVPGPRVPLELLSSRTFAGGCVYSSYRVRRTRKRAPKV
jgi:dihydrofolate reductase